MPVSRAEFEKIVKEMQAKGTSLSMANLMVRTELPRAQIEAWLDEIQRDVKFVPSKEKREGAKKAKAEPKGDEEDDEGESSGGGPMGALSALKQELLGEMVKSKLGLGTTESKSSGKKDRRGIRTGGVLGLAMPPAALFYSAPYYIAALGTVAYLGVAWLSLKTFVYGGLYLLILAHLVGGVLGAGYAWRFNRKGKRAVLLPKDAPVRRTKGGRDVEDDD